MDHTSMTVMVLRHGDLVRHVGYSGTMDRKFAHYDGLYRHLLNGGTVVRPATSWHVRLPRYCNGPPRPIPDVWR